MVEGDYRSYSYQHNGSFPAGTSAASVPGDPGNVTVIGGAGQVYVPGFTATDTDIDGRLALKVADPRLYVGVGYLSRSENYGYPRQGGFGFGAEKLPDLDQPFSVYGSIWYYPSVSANFSSPSANGQFSYRDLKYQVGATYTLGAFSGIGIFIDGGYLGDSLRGKSLAPSDSTHNGPYVGLGLKF
jgi:hypothetical protein